MVIIISNNFGRQNICFLALLQNAFSTTFCITYYNNETLSVGWDIILLKEGEIWLAINNLWRFEGGLLKQFWDSSGLKTFIVMQWDVGSGKQVPQSWLAAVLANWLLYWLTDCCSDSLDDVLFGWLASWLTDWLLYWLTDCCTGWPAAVLTNWLLLWLTEYYTGWMTTVLPDWLPY